jgi:hypothetical protein
MIKPEHVKALLESEAEEPTLIVVSGAAEVVPASALGTDQYRGAMEVVSRRDVTAQLGIGDATPHDLEEIAARLKAAVTRLGA